MNDEETKPFVEIVGYNLKGELPDPFTFDNGERIHRRGDWKKRRLEIYKSAVELQFGGMPPEPEFLDIDALYAPTGSGINVYRIRTGRREKPISFTMTLRLPYTVTSATRPPAVISCDPCFEYSHSDGVINTFLENGIAYVTFERCELSPDLAEYDMPFLEDFKAAAAVTRRDLDKIVRGERVGQIYETYPDCSFGTVAAWAWGFSRCVDALELLSLVDTRYIAFTGHSRGGKTAILAGAVDERAAIVNPVGTCAGGCSCYRIKIKALNEKGELCESEDIANIFRHFPLWMGDGMKEFVDNEENLPFDSHYLKALVAPRVLLVCERASDIMANPVGSWQTTEAAKEVYRFLGCEQNLLWYIGSGGHRYDRNEAELLVNAIKHLKDNEPLSERLFKLPFKRLEPAYSWRAPENFD